MGWQSSQRADSLAIANECVKGTKENLCMVRHDSESRVCVQQYWALSLAGCIMYQKHPWDVDLSWLPILHLAEDRCWSPCLNLGVFMECCPCSCFQVLW